MKFRAPDDWPGYVGLLIITVFSLASAVIAFLRGNVAIGCVLVVVGIIIGAITWLMTDADTTGNYKYKTSSATSDAAPAAQLQVVGENTTKTLPAPKAKALR